MKRNLHFITLQEPHASLVALDLKPFETRSWPKPKTVDLLGIHAGKGIDFEVFRGPDRRYYLDAFQLPPKPTDDEIRRVMRSGILCICETEESIRTTGQAPASRRWHSRSAWHRVSAFGDFTKGRYAWPVKPILLLSPPALTPGKQGTWFAPPEIERVIRASLKFKFGIV